jgi:hypothetical protein
MKESSKSKEFVLYMLSAMMVLLLIFLDYRLLEDDLISIEVYSLLLSILGGTFFLFLQKAYSLSYERAVERLSMVPQIQSLCQTAEEKKGEIENLEKEKERLEHIIEVAAKRYYLEKRQNDLERRLKNTYNELVSAKEEIEDLNLEIDGTLADKQIKEIESYILHRERGDFVFHIGKKRFAVPSSLFDSYPFGIIGLVALLISELRRNIEKIFRK